MECCGVMWSDVRCCVSDVWVCGVWVGGRVVDEEYSMGLDIILAGQYHILFA